MSRNQKNITPLSPQATGFLSADEATREDTDLGYYIRKNSRNNFSVAELSYMIGQLIGVALAKDNPDTKTAMTGLQLLAKMHQPKGNQTLAGPSAAVVALAERNKIQPTVDVPGEMKYSDG